MMVGQLRVTGGQDVAGVLGDAVRGIRTDRQRNGETAAAGADHLTTANAMARAMGVMPLANGQPAIVDNLARFGLFTDQALRLGLDRGADGDRHPGSESIAGREIER